MAQLEIAENRHQEIQSHLGPARIHAEPVEDGRGENGGDKRLRHGEEKCRGGGGKECPGRIDAERGHRGGDDHSEPDQTERQAIPAMRGPELTGPPQRPGEPAGAPSQQGPHACEPSA